MNPAALFVRKDTHYSALGCDCYDVERDALTWQGGVPCIAHPPCRSWSRLSHFAKPLPGERELALWAMDKVRRFGGVLEHPLDSRLWRETGCLSYGVRDLHGGVLVPALQSWWGHRAPKRTGFYICGPVPELPYSDELAVGRIENMNVAERERTPLQLATWLVQTAKACA